MRYPSHDHPAKVRMPVSQTKVHPLRRWPLRTKITLGGTLGSHWFLHALGRSVQAAVEAKNMTGRNPEHKVESRQEKWCRDWFSYIGLTRKLQTCGLRFTGRFSF